MEAAEKKGGGVISGDLPGQKNSMNKRPLDAGLEGTKTQVLNGYCSAKWSMQTDTLPFRRNGDQWGMELYERTTS